jgi:hypothetical protein
MRLADLIALDPGADITVRAVQSLLLDADFEQDSPWQGPVDGGVLALTGTMLRLAAPDIADRLDATLNELFPGLVHDPRLSSALDRASGLLKDVGLVAEHDQAVAQVDKIVANRRYEQITVAVFDLLNLRLAREALPPQVRVVAAPTAFARSLSFSHRGSAVRAGFHDPFRESEPDDIPVEFHPASAPVLLSPGALTAVRRCVGAKHKWLGGRLLITADSRDLVRFPSARHIAGLLAPGGVQ